MAFSTTIKKVAFEMKMEDLERDGEFIEWKDETPFWRKRFDTLMRTVGDDPNACFLVGSVPHYFKIKSLLGNVPLAHVPEKYRSFLNGPYVMGIRCERHTEDY